jgi:hypothetical protein
MKILQSIALVLAIILCSILIIALLGAFGVFLAVIGWLVALGVIAHHKGRSVAAWTLPFLIVPPIIGLLILPFLKNLALRKCPACRETIKKEATVCKHCHSAVPAAGEHDQTNKRLKRIFDAVEHDANRLEWSRR